MHTSSVKKNDKFDEVNALVGTAWIMNARARVYMFAWHHWFIMREKYRWTANIFDSTNKSPN
jgi:hypothetical protein